MAPDVRPVRRTLVATGARGLTAGIPIPKPSPSDGAARANGFSVRQCGGTVLVPQPAHASALRRTCCAFHTLAGGAVEFRLRHHAGRDGARCGMANPQGRGAIDYKSFVR